MFSVSPSPDPSSAGGDEFRNAEFAPRAIPQASAECAYELPHHAQEEGYTCGAASLRIGIEGLSGEKFSEAELARFLGSSPTIGSPLATFSANLPRVLEELSRRTGKAYESRVEQGGSIEGLKELLGQKWVVLVNYTPISIPHWAALKKIDTARIHFVDSAFGPKHSVPLARFNWRGGVAVPSTRAFVAIRELPYIPD